MAASLGARLEAAKELVRRRHPYWSWLVILALTCEVLSSLLMVSLPTWYSSPWATLGWALPVTYLLAAERSGNPGGPLERPATLLIPMRHSLYGLGSERRTAFAPRVWSLLRTAVLICVLVYPKMPKVTQHSECCPSGGGREERCQLWGTEGLPGWVPCGRVDPKCYHECQAEMNPAWLFSGVCNTWVGTCHMEEGSPAMFAVLVAAMLPLFGGILEPILAVLLSVSSCRCAWCPPQDAELQQLVDQRAEAIDEEVASGQRTNKGSLLVFFSAFMYYLDIVLDLNGAVQYYRTGNLAFSAVAGTIWFSSLYWQCRKGQVTQVFSEACASYRRGLRTDRLIHILAQDQSSEAVPTLLLQWYAIAYVTSNNFAALTCGFSLMLGLVSVVRNAHDSVHLGLDLVGDGEPAEGYDSLEPHGDKVVDART